MHRGTNLHGPLVERMVELPMDIYEGRVGGELRIKSHNRETWEFPELFGLVRSVCVCVGGEYRELP